MFKMIILAKRKKGMSLEAFREYYETRHAPLAMSLAPEPVARYVRNYLTPVADGAEPPYDVVTETWFESEAQYRRNFAALAAAPEKMATIAADEENLFDRSTITFFTAEEVESTL
jgi:uncharacterized protein (TIGR02118 family)